MPDEVIEIEEDGVVVVETEEGATTDKPIVARTTNGERTRQKTTADDAAAALAQAIKATETESKAREQAESSRRAAEATAMAERQRAEAAQRLADQRGQEARSYRDQAESTRLVVINTGIESATREVAAYQDEYARAMEAGEFTKAASANAKLSKASAALDRLETDKATFEANVVRGGTTEGRVEVPQVSTEPPFEQYVKGFAPVAQAWLRQHPECVPAFAGGDAVANAKMMLGHETAVRKGLTQGSDAYFQTIEEHTGHRQPVVNTTQTTSPTSSAAEVTEAGTTARQQTRAAATPSAPVTRDPPGPGGVPTRQSVRLTPEQQEVALMSFQPRKVRDAVTGRVVDEPEADYRRRAFALYAENLIAATKEGKIGRMTH
jgi:hypothetical protein